MKHLFLKNNWLTSLLFCSIALALNSCNDDFDPTGTFTEIPVVYGLLDHSETAQYIRIERAFLDSKTSALVLAKDTNALYFKNLNASIQQLNNSGAVVNTLPLVRVSGAAEGLPRANGVFANDPNYLYKTTASLLPSTRYRLVIQTAENKTYTAETTTLENFNLLDPLLNLTGNPSVVKFKQNATTNIRWSWGGAAGAATNAAFYDLNIRIGVDEKEASGVFRRSYDWSPYKNIVPEKGKTSVQQNITDGEAFFIALRNLVPQNPAVISRCGRSIRLAFEITAGGSELYQYINSSVSATSIASTDAVYKYTNIKDGRGVFSSKFTRKNIEQFELEQSTMDEISVNSATKDLKFTTYTGSCN